MLNSRQISIEISIKNDTINSKLRFIYDTINKRPLSPSCERMMNTNYWENLESRRRSLGVSFAALSERTGISTPTLKRIFSGKVSPAIDKIQSIAGVLGVEVRVNDKIEIVATSSVEEVRKQVAREKAKWLVGIVQGTSALEAQAVGPDTIREMVERTTHELLAGPNRKLWAA
jgi:transcriptional regulator with XRE-family HTH domain